MVGNNLILVYTHTMKKNKSVVLILDNLRSVYNTASLFRTADCAGVLKIHLVGTTPTPVDKFNRLRKDFAKVSLGAEGAVAWEYTKTMAPVLTKLKKQGYTIYALEQDKKSVHYKKAKYADYVALICGNEPYGIDKKVLTKVDTIIEIPQFGTKESLNVVVATGIVLFEIVG
jgi:23S rRNA (guanosine2251-2'-O)-methyltransferase